MLLAHLIKKYFIKGNDHYWPELTIIRLHQPILVIVCQQRNKHAALIPLVHRYSPSSWSWPIIDCSKLLSPPLVSQHSKQLIQPTNSSNHLIQPTSHHLQATLPSQHVRSTTAGSLRVGPQPGHGALRSAPCAELGAGHRAGAAGYGAVGRSW